MAAKEAEHDQLLNDIEQQSDNEQSLAFAIGPDEAQTVEIKPETPISLNTIFKSIDFGSLIAENILLVLWNAYYKDSTPFKRSDIFWAIYIFAYLSTLDGFIYNSIALILFETAQFLLYSWFCNFNTISTIIFFLLLFVEFFCKLIPKLIYKSADSQSSIIHKKIHETTKEYKFFSQAKWINSMALTMIFTTVPMFYYNQCSLIHPHPHPHFDTFIHVFTARIFGSIWFAVSVVFVIWYHKLMNSQTLLFKDVYVRKLMNKIGEKHDGNSVDESLFKSEVSRPIKEYKYYGTVMNIIPIIYYILLLILLIIYLSVYSQSELSQFEYAYSIFLCVSIGSVFVFYVCQICIDYHERRKNVQMTLEEILHEAKQNPSISDLVGTWVIGNESTPISAFVLKQENIIGLTEEERNQQHKLGNLGCCGSINPHNSAVVGAIKVPLNCVKFRNGKPWCFAFADEQMYKFLLHQNVIVKFVPINDALPNKMVLARSDSKGWIDWFKNMKHSNKYGCFCLGVLTKDGKFKRFNRWNADVDYFYTAVSEQVASYK